MRNVEHARPTSDTDAPCKSEYHQTKQSVELTAGVVFNDFNYEKNLRYLRTHTHPWLRLIPVVYELLVNTNTVPGIKCL